MPEFRVPVLEDKNRIDDILSNADFEGSFYSFAAIYTWAERYNTKIAFYNDALLISGRTESLGLYFLYPVGSFKVDEVIEIMKKEAEINKSPLRIIAEKRQAEELYRTFPDRFDFSDSRDDWDYVYSAEDLAYLKGNKYHGKRNHISRLIKKYGEQAFSFEFLDLSNIHECMSIERQWVLDKEDDSDLINVEKSLSNFDALSLSGGLIRLNGKAITFTVGEALNDETFIIHIEKSLSGYDGSYQMINQLFAKTLVGKFNFINREEDMGIEGLRSSKMSYFPCKMIEKCVVTERN